MYRGFVDGKNHTCLRGDGTSYVQVNCSDLLFENSWVKAEGQSYWSIELRIRFVSPRLLPMGVFISQGDLAYDGSAEKEAGIKRLVPSRARAPVYKTSPARLAVELNPVDSSGSPTKKRGLVLRSKEELEQYRELFQFDKLLPLLEGIDRVNPQVKKAVAAKHGEEVLEI